MHYLRKTPLFSFLLALGFVYSVSSMAFALTISPPRVEIALDPGEIYSGSYTLRNDSSFRATYYSEYENFTSQGESGVPEFIGADFGLGTWIDGPEKIILEPGELRKLEYVIRIPSDATPGGYFAALLWSNRPQSTGDNGNVQVASRLGTLLLLRVNGEVVEKAELTDLSFSPKNGLVSVFPSSVSYRVENGGADRILPEGTITVDGMFKKGRVNKILNDGAGNVLPSGSRTYSSILRPEHENIIKTQWNEFAFGVYKANVDLKYGPKEEHKLTQTYKFFVFPYQLLALIFGCVLLFRFLIKKGFESMKASIIEKALKQQKK